MYNRFRRCGNMPYYNNEALEDICDDVANIPNSCYCMNKSSMNMEDCNCGFDKEENVFPLNPMLAQSYVPFQYMDRTFKPCVGLKMGTIFPELVSPYTPGQSMEEIKYIERTNKIGKGCNKCC